MGVDANGTCGWTEASAGGVWSSFLLLRVIRAWHLRAAREARCPQTTGRTISRTTADALKRRTFCDWSVTTRQRVRQKEFVRGRKERNKEETRMLQRRVLLDGFAKNAARRRQFFEKSCVLSAAVRTRVFRQHFAEWSRLLFAERFSQEAEERRVRRAVSRWRQWSLRERERGEKVVRAVRERQKKFLARVFRTAWRDTFVKTSQQGREDAGRILHHRTQRTRLGFAWGVWQSARQRLYLRWVRPRKHYVCGLLRKVLFTLKLCVLRRLRLRDIGDAVQVRVAQLRRKRWLPVWHKYAVETALFRRSSREKEEAFAENTVRPNLLRRAFRAWHSFWVRWKQLVAALDAHERDGVLRPFFRCWRDDFVLRLARPQTCEDNKRACGFYLRKALAGRILPFWRAAAAERRKQRAFLRSALSFWYTGRMRVSVSSWRKLVERGRRKRLRESEAEALFQEASRKTAVRGILHLLVAREEQEEARLRRKFEADWANDMLAAKQEAGKEVTLKVSMLKDAGILLAGEVN
eukprot:g8696.t1